MIDLRTLDTDMVILVSVHKYFFLESWYIVKVFLVYVKCKKNHYSILFYCTSYIIQYPHGFFLVPAVHAG